MQQYTQSLLDSGYLEGLEPKKFTTMLEYFAKRDKFSFIRDHALARLEQDRLSIKDFYLLLIESNDFDVQNLVLDYLDVHVKHAPSIIAMGLTQGLQWQEFQYLEDECRPDFRAKLQVKIGNQAFVTSKFAQATKKQLARNMASLIWLKDYVNAALVSSELQVNQNDSKSQDIALESSQFSSSPKKLKVLGRYLSDSGNMVGLLIQFCQVERLSMPDYEIVQSGDCFTCRCQLMAWGKAFTSQALAKKKQHSRRLAARAMLEQLNAYQGKTWSSV